MNTFELHELSMFRPDRATITSDEFWTKAVRRAREMGPYPEPFTFRSGSVPPIGSPEEAVARLREELGKCVMAFPALLAISPAPKQAGYENMDAWSMRVPLTLFPSRDRAFSLIDIAVQFEAAPRALQITRVLPVSEDRSLAQIDLSALVSVKAGGSSQVELGDPSEIMAVADVAAEAGMTFATENLVTEVARAVINSQALEGVRAVWRLDQPERPLKNRPDAAALAVEFVTAPTAGAVNVTAAAIAYSSAQWLSSDLGSLWGHMVELFGRLFAERQPTECRAQWANILAEVRTK